MQPLELNLNFAVIRISTSHSKLHCHSYTVKSNIINIIHRIEKLQMKNILSEILVILLY